MTGMLCGAVMLMLCCCESPRTEGLFRDQVASTYETRTFSISPVLLREEGIEMDPFHPQKMNEGKFFEEFGVTSPRGAHVAYDPVEWRLTVTHTPEALDRIKQVLSQIQITDNSWDNSVKARRIRIYEKLDSIRLKEIRLNEDDILNDFSLTTLCHEMDPTGVAIAFFFETLDPNVASKSRGTGLGKKKLSFYMKDVLLRTALRTFAEEAGLQYYVSQKGVHMFPSYKDADSIQICILEINPHIFRRQSLSDMMKKAGVKFPRGTGISGNCTDGVLTVRHTPENIIKIKDAFHDAEVRRLAIWR